MRSSNNQINNLHVIGIRVSTIRERSHLDEYMNKLLDHVRKIIHDLPVRTTDTTTLLVMQEYAFTPYPIPSETKDKFKKELEKIINQSPLSIILVPGSFLHYKKRKMDNSKSKAKAQVSSRYYENCNSFYQSSARFGAEPAEAKHARLILNKNEFYSLRNTAYILCNNTILKHYKSEDAGERLRFDEKGEQKLIKNETVVFVGDGKDSIQNIQLKNGLLVKLGLLICKEKSFTFHESDQLAHMAIKQSEPSVDIELVISDSISVPQLKDKSSYGNVTIYMDSYYGLHVVEKPGIEKKFNVTHEDMPPLQFYIQIPLHEAAQKGDLATVKSLIEQGGVSVNAIDHARRTALFMAAQKGHLDVVKYLVENGADYTLSMDNIHTPLSFALLNNHADVVIYLEDLAQQDRTYPPLLRAATLGDLAKVKSLIEEGANLNIQDKNCNTAIYIAADNGHLDVLKYLVELGANYETFSYEMDMTPVEIATAMGHKEIVSYFNQIANKNVSVSTSNMFSENKLENNRDEDTGPEPSQEYKNNKRG